MNSEEIISDIISNVKGWITYHERLYLIKNVKDKTVLEIGTFFGLSTLLMATTAKKVVTIDCFDGQDSTTSWSNDDTLLASHKNIKKYQPNGKVIQIVGKIQDVVSYLDLSLFDVVFYDAEHTYESTLFGINALSGVRPDCTWIFHDYPIIHRAVDEFFNSTYKGSKNQMWWVDSICAFGNNVLPSVEQTL